VLHPATRRLLHGEIARTRPKAAGQPPSFLELLTKLWPRLALATSAVVAVGLIIWAASSKTDSQMHLATAEKKPMEESLTLRAGQERCSEQSGSPLHEARASPDLIESF